jgi:hypothetical protein
MLLKVRVGALKVSSARGKMLLTLKQTACNQLHLEYKKCLLFKEALNTKKCTFYFFFPFISKEINKKHKGTLKHT